MTEEIERPNQIEYRDAEIAEADAETYEAERRYVGTAVIETDTMRPIQVRTVYEIDDDGCVHQSTHYYAASEPTQNSHIMDMINHEWEPTTDVGSEEFEQELLDELTYDATVEVDVILDRVRDGRVNARKLGIDI